MNLRLLIESFLACRLSTSLTVVGGSLATLPPLSTLVIGLAGMCMTTLHMLLYKSWPCHSYGGNVLLAQAKPSILFFHADKERIRPGVSLFYPDSTLRFVDAGSLSQDKWRIAKSLTDKGQIWLCMFICGSQSRGMPTSSRVIPKSELQLQVTLPM